MPLFDAANTVHHRIAAGDTPRIVSLVPSLTELLCDLGLAGALVGRTGFCVHPAGLVAAIQKVGGTKSVNIEKIRKLAPTHLVVNIDENEKPIVEALAAFIPHVIVTHPKSPLDNPGLYRLLGGIFAAEDRAEALCGDFDAALAALTALTALTKAPVSRSTATTAPKRGTSASAANAGLDPGTNSASAASKKTVLYCIWKDPWMTISGDTYIARMLELIGWRHTTLPEQQTGTRYPTFQWSANLVADVDEILLSSEPYSFTEEHVDALEQQVGKPVRLVDGEMLSWYGSRAIAGLRYLKTLASE
ncbi:MAG: ABC-type Fe3+-hydroxamate transport system, substrate-binding protein [Herminiimonas sp.]|nr:ABC-type Fe3+-hydroxamate transport system, substrate-binding protein [Herminiimonas sp.]MDB5855436.1 ABC-type Fe3+-hydroxamate transport system, substrate-binding protein [Herminiimonas sp.]